MRLYSRIPRKFAEKVLDDPGIGISAVIRELNVSASNIMLVLNDNIRCYSHTHHRGQLLTEKSVKIA